MSASSWLGACGIMIQLRARRGPDIFLMRESGWRSIAPYCAKSTFGQGGRPNGSAPAAERGSESARLTNDCTSSRVTRPFGPLAVTVARSTPNSRANLLIEGLACTAAPLGAEGGAAGVGLAAGCAAPGADGGTRTLGAGCAPAGTLLASVTIFVPFETLSPTFTSTDFTTPASGDGTSIDAFSDSSVTSADSFCTASPGFTKTSITGTSLKSPRSGTVTSTTRALGEGTSIEAFSDSSVINGASFSTLSPGLTNTSITGTSLKSPMFGTRTSTAPATPYTVTGFGLFGSIAYRLSACATVAGLIVPSSASALSAATAT